MKNLFFGGIHPKYNKEMSTKETSFRTISPKQVVIPMQQHIGNPCTPLVKVGDHVLWGQKIGDGEGLRMTFRIQQLTLMNCLRPQMKF